MALIPSFLTSTSPISPFALVFYICLWNCSDFAYKRQLQEWIDLSVQKSIPISLLIMSRAFMLTSTDKKLDSVSILNTQDVLQSSMSSLDSDTINEVILAVAKPNEESLPEIQKRKLESLEFQQELIEEEREESEEAKQELLSIKVSMT